MSSPNPWYPLTRWTRALDAAGVADPALRRDYGAQRRAVLRYRTEAYLAARLLVPPELVPHLVVATAFMHRTDDMLDSGPVALRREAFARWDREVRAALVGGASADPLVRALVHSSAVLPALGGHVTAYLDTALTDLDFAGFADEAEYQAYVDAYSLPAVLVPACVLAPVSPELRVACRAWIDGGQRVDFVADLAEDLAAGRLTVPQETLTAFAVTREDLVAGRGTEAVGALLAHLLDLSEASLAEGRALVDLTPAATRPMVRVMVRLDELTAQAARAKSTALLREGARPALLAALGLVWREYRAARRAQRLNTGSQGESGPSARQSRLGEGNP
ncbi:phytoene/squalene synthase family protein [Streptacidiphilus jiangxiensis]|uniref:Phytoene synthase n=1 Tax=Streptacidiphilus jiangxiensis TaxID=235985 RepID=A0A1H7YG58_STRJI|nr:squalene/phytoene synthase family protein [Streptacidiphilus jiangxiensis]SEM44864.1 phytoene synthase [Streptacidiphilus jiangxiensis]